MFGNLFGYHLCGGNNMVMIEVITKCGVSVVQLRRGGLC